MSESADYQNLLRHFNRRHGRVDRVENFLVPGMPDINLCCAGVESWIEQKGPWEPVRKRTPLFGSNHPVSQDQKNWFLKQVQAGGKCWFLITTNKRWMLIHGKFGETINKMTVEQLVVAASWHALRPVAESEWENLWRILSRR